MTPPQIVFVLFVSLGLLTLVFEVIRRRMLRERYAMVWILIALGMASIPFLYRYYIDFAALVGIRDPNSFFFYGAIVSLFLLCLQFSLAVSAAHAHHKALAQQLALVEERLRRLEQGGGECGQATMKA